MTEQHVPIEDLAAYAAGDLDPATAVTVEAHVVLCGACRADVDAVRAATERARALPPVTMPADVAGRLDAALAAERAPGATAAPLGDVLPMRRRRPSLAGLSAVAAGVALLAAITVPLVTSRDSEPTAAREGAVAAPAAATKRLTSNLDYSRENLAATLGRALSGVSADAKVMSRDNNKSSGAPLPVSAAPTAAPLGPTFGGTRTTSEAVSALSTDAGRMGACLAALVGDLPAAGRMPLVVDFARFSGRDAVVFVFPTVTTGGEVRRDRVDVYVVGSGCGSEPGGDILDFQRIPRPANL
ncbi:MAG TPA: zf-HC2 domain-containing protein [Mycobacteriales bacterium]|jgi:anti-sigma factor RsiW